MESRLQIRRVRAEYLVPAEHPSPERIKDRLDQELSARVVTSLSSALASWFSDSDPSIWLVRQLDIDLAVNTGWSSEQLTRVFTAQFGRTLGTILDESAERDNVVHFSSRAAFLASFLQDLAAGHAWKHWYYESFAGLRMLATSAALRTAICDQSEPGREALLRLATGELQDVLRTLTRHDAGLVLDHLAATVVAGDEASCCDVAWRAWQTINASAFDQLEQSQRALLLYLAASRDGRELGLNLKRAALSIICLADRLRSDSAAQREQLIRALTNGALAELYQVASGDAEVLSPLLRCSPDWLREVAASINQLPSEPADESTVRRYTSFGGVFLLLPFIDELPLIEACRAFPHADEAAAISLVRFLILIKCSGQRNVQRTFRDPLFRDLLLISPAVSMESIRNWHSRIAVTDVQRFLHTLLEWQRGQGSVTGFKQVLARTDSQEGAAVLIDGARGVWVMAVGGADELVDALTEPLANLEKDGVLLCDHSLLAELRAAFPSLRILSLTGSQSDEDQVRGILARLDKIPLELEHLALPESLQLSRRFDLALSLAAQHVMRDFASRLPDFAQSNLLYLWINFLDFPASLEEEPERRVVRMERPPLGLVPGFAALMRQTYHLSWLDDRPLTLFEES